MSRTYRRSHNKSDKPIPVNKIGSFWFGIFEIKPIPDYKYISDSYYYNWTHKLKEAEKTNRRAKDKATIDKILNDLEFADEAIFYNNNYADPWCFD